MIPGPLDDFLYLSSRKIENINKNKASSLGKSKSSKNLLGSKSKRDEFLNDMRKAINNEIIVGNRSEKLDLDDLILEYRALCDAEVQKEQILHDMQKVIDQKIHDDLIEYENFNNTMNIIDKEIFQNNLELQPINANIESFQIRIANNNILKSNLEKDLNQTELDLQVANSKLDKTVKRYVLKNSTENKLDNFTFEKWENILCRLCKTHIRCIYQKPCKHMLLCWRCYLAQWENNFDFCVDPNCSMPIKRIHRILYANCYN